jgi:hypothetical protein
MNRIDENVGSKIEEQQVRRFGSEKDARLAKSSSDFAIIYLFNLIMGWMLGSLDIANSVIYNFLLFQRREIFWF